MQRWLENYAPSFIRWLLIATLFTPLIITSSTIFPFVFGKQLAANFLIEIAFALWLILALRQPEYRPSRTGLLWVVLGFLGISFVSAIVGESFTRSFWSTVERMGGVWNLAHWGAFFVMLPGVFRSWPDWRRLLRINLAVSALVSIYALLQNFGVEGSMIYLSGTDRISGTLGNPTFLPLYLTFTVFSAAALLTITKKRAWQLGYAALIVLELYVIFLSEGRGAFAGITLSIFLLSSFWVFWSRIYWQRILAAVIALVILGTGFLVTIGRDWQASRFLADRVEVVKRLRDTNLTGGGLEKRLQSARFGLSAWQERPVLGWGPENYTLAFSKHLQEDFYKINEYISGVWFDKAHNKPIEVLVTTGIIGLGVYLSLFVLLGVYLYRLFQKDQRYARFYLFLSAAFLAYFVQLLSLFDTPVSYLQFFLFAGFIQWAHGSVIKQGSTQYVGGNSLLPKKWWFLAFAVIVVGLVFILYQFGIKPWESTQVTKQAVDSENADSKRAMELYQQAERQTPVWTINNNRNAAQLAAGLLQDQNLPPEQRKAIAKMGIEFAEKNIEAAPDFKDWMVLGRLYFNGRDVLQNGTQKALSALEKARAAGPNRREHLELLSFAHFVRGDYAKAKELLLKYRDLNGDFHRQEKEYLQQIESRLR